MTARRISIGPGEVAGYFSRLKAGFDELGVPCEHFVLTPNKFSYQESEYFLRFAFRAGNWLYESKSNIAQNLGHFWSLSVCSLVFLYALIRCDVFIFSGFTSFLRFRELPLLRLLGKKVVVVFLGSDARPPIFSGRHLDDKGAHVDPEEAYEEAKRMVSKIRKIEKYADVIVSHTATAQFLSRDFIRFMAVGMPINSNLVVNNDQEERDKPIRILHAPSRPLAKGSLEFRKIIEELKAEGFSIDFIELLGVPNREVLLELQKCDFVIDELYSDIPLAMFATEAAIFSKPVVVGGYYALQYQNDNPDTHVPPALYVEPEDIKQAVRTMIIDSDFRLDLGRRANDFIQGKWNACTVAQNYLRLFERELPENWKASPENLEYFWGWGLSKDQWRKKVGEYVVKLGEGALLLDCNPKLKQRVLNELGQIKVARIP